MPVRVLPPAARDIIDVTAKVIRVDQHSSTKAKVDQLSAHKPGAYDLSPGITTSELFITLTKRLTELPEQLSDVDKYYLFVVWTELDRHLTEASQSTYQEVSLPEDTSHVKSAFSSCVGDDDAEHQLDDDLDNWELRTLFRQDAINDIVEMENDAF